MNVASNTIFTGDNLIVMRGMNSESVDLIYLDPPFNSNRSYAAPVGSKAAGAEFKDMWRLSDVNVEETKEYKKTQPALYNLIKAAGGAHSKSMESYILYMAIRLEEMYRILKPTGSIYLHCDDTASHYLKIVIDNIFGAKQYRNEITWKRTSSQHNKASRFGRVLDTIFYYTKGDKYTWNPQYAAEYSKSVIQKYSQRDEHGLYGGMSLKAPGSQRTFEFKGHVPPGRGWAYTLEQMQEWDKQGRIILTKNGVPQYKRYLSESKGTPINSLWLDIDRLWSMQKEYLGYPTQKPLALLERIIRASSNKGDMVFDPFCGCATTLVAATKLGRQWVGCDISPMAVKLVKDRLKGEGLIQVPVIARDTAPKRTDTGKLPHYRKSKNFLYGKQEGDCAGCGEHFNYRILEVDHILPRSKGGTDHLDNLQLLCSYCNRSKGGRTMAQWKAAKGVSP